MPNIWYHQLDEIVVINTIFKRGQNYTFLKNMHRELIGLNTINVVWQYVLERIIYVLNSLLTNLHLYLRYFHNLISDKHFSLCMLIILAKYQHINSFLPSADFFANS